MRAPSARFGVVHCAKHLTIHKPFIKADQGSGGQLLDGRRQVGVAGRGGVDASLHTRRWFTRAPSSSRPLPGTTRRGPSWTSPEATTPQDSVHRLAQNRLGCGQSPFKTPRTGPTLSQRETSYGQSATGTTRCGSSPRTPNNPQGGCDETSGHEKNGDT